MLLFLMDVDFACDWILIQIFYAHRFVDYQLKVEVSKAKLNTH